MSDEKQLDPSILFTEKLDIRMVTVERARQAIDANAGVPSVIVTLMGPPGIGKSKVCVDAATNRGAPCYVFAVASASHEDFWIPTGATDNRQYYDRRIPRGFEPLLAWCKEQKDQGDILPGKNPILCLDELNRAKDDSVLKAIMQLIDLRRIGDTALPSEIQIVATMNPTGNGMNVKAIEKEPAWRRRLTFYGVTCNYGEFMRYARKAKYHPQVLAHLDAQPVWLYDMAAAAKGAVYPCPASWSTISDMCYAYVDKKISLTSPVAQDSFAGKIGMTAMTAFVEFIQDSSVVITAEEVLTDYKKGSALQERYLALINSNANAAITALGTNVAEKIYDGTDRKPSVIGSRLAQFMIDTPEEFARAFIYSLTQRAKATEGGLGHLSRLTTILQGYPELAQLLARFNEIDKMAESDEAAA